MNGVECPEPVEGQIVVYILECSDQSYYVGCSHDLKRRLKDHDKGRASTWTAKRSPVYLVYYEFHSDLLVARKRERQIKQWSRLKKEKLISGEWGRL